MKGLILHPLRLRAAHDGRLKVMRVPFKVQPASVEYWLHGLQVETPHDHPIFRDKDGKGWSQCGPFEPPYANGEKRFVKEAFLGWWNTKDQTLSHIAAWKMSDYKLECGERWCHPRELPGKHARLTVTLVNPRPERVQDVTEGEAKAEGVYQMNTPQGVYYLAPRCGERPEYWETRAVDAFSYLWDTIYPRYPWAENGWVWRYDVEIGRVG